ncbi:DMT family transporter [Streptomyces sp. NPDC044780]|uniref:DMT family transporter n=1 Tax=Streptomyces luomodiensis TaxID=3026192 RepID=A0ABY9V7K6_9ACTN|nr:DMT family transporter [Streptomyces sp. SCA4-21]WNF00587.1 DMT family transporter [Streptomyces sp. SCA4-21]
MNVAAVVLALLSALGNGAASVLQRRAAMDQVREERGARGPKQNLLRLTRLLRRPYWLAGLAAMVVSAVAQVGALAVGRLSVVQPLLVSELLFTLVVGSLVFRHRPDGRTWLSFVTLAAGLALFLVAADPSHGQNTAQNGEWLPVGVAVAIVVGILIAVARMLRGAARAATLGCATAACFACTAALIKEFTGRFSGGVAEVFTDWPLYAVCAVGLLSFLLLQSTLRAGTLAASQPALTLGDALVSVTLGWVLFGERVELGLRVLPEVAGILLMAAGIVGLTRSPAMCGGWDQAVPGHPDLAARNAGKPRPPLPGRRGHPGGGGTP